jgi:hypothetical protein
MVMHCGCLGNNIASLKEEVMGVATLNLIIFSIIQND